MAVKRGDFLISHRSPLRTHLPEPVKPSLPILALKAGRLPDKEQPLARKQIPNSPHKVRALFTRALKVVKRLAHPYDINRLVVQPLIASTKS